MYTMSPLTNSPHTHTPTHTHTHMHLRLSSVPVAEVGRIHCQPFFTTCLLQCINATLPNNNMYNRFQAFTIISYHLFIAFSISMVTSTDRAMVMGWGSVKTRQSTPLNSSPSPMQARWWVCKISISTSNFSVLWKLQHEWHTCSQCLELWPFGFLGLCLIHEQKHIWHIWNGSNKYHWKWPTERA